MWFRHVQKEEKRKQDVWLSWTVFFSSVPSLSRTVIHIHDRMP